MAVIKAVLSVVSANINPWLHYVDTFSSLRITPPPDPFIRTESSADLVGPPQFCQRGHIVASCSCGVKK